MVEKKEHSKGQIVSLILEPYTIDILRAIIKQPMRFTDLAKVVHNETTLSSKLSKLMEYELIEFAPAKLPDKRYSNAYKISSIGKRIMRELESINVI